MMKPTLAIAAALAILASPAAAEPAPADEAAEARIPFANHGGIRDWRTLDRDTLLIEGQNRQWYRAELMSPCHDLPFANAIGFVPEANGSFDRFSAVVVRGQYCPVRSLVKTEAPARKRGKQQG